MAKKSHDKFTTKLNAIKSVKVEQIKSNEELLTMLEEDILSENDESDLKLQFSDNEEEAEEEEEVEIIDVINKPDDEESAEPNWYEDEEQQEDDEEQQQQQEDEDEEYQVEYLEEEFNVKKEPEETLSDNTVIVDEYFEVQLVAAPKKSGEGKSYPCKHCNEISDSKKEHLNHLKTHKSLGKFLKLNCHLCGKKFKDQDIYDGHLKVHEGLPAYSCEYCEKTFNYKNNYQTHILLHTNERPFPCNLCEKSFRSKWDLTIHIRVHNDIRKYECNICGKKFRVSSHMTSHQYTHSSKSFECDICFQKYISPRTLKQHKATVHSDEQPYECTFDGCQKKFKRKHHVDNHMKTHTTKVTPILVLSPKIAIAELMNKSVVDEDEFEDEDDLLCEMDIT